MPLARLGEPSEIASVVAFLVSDSAGYITGETIHVNGGMYGLNVIYMQKTQIFCVQGYILIFVR